MRQTSIAVITCYSGKLPWYFYYFVHSCTFNPTIDFFVIIDDSTADIRLPDNVKIILKSLGEISALATQQLGFPVNISYGYKLCDFKPAYGVIFADLLTNYAFWGYCDIDIIFGDIREFITEELLAIHDLISVRHDWITGCFLLYKNESKTTNLFMLSKDYRKVFMSDIHYCFDETNFAHDEFTDGKSYTEVKTEIESMMHVVKKLEASNDLKPYFEFIIIEGVPGNLKWEAGKMYYRNKFEVLLYHLIYFKKCYNPAIKKWTPPTTFTISANKIYHKAAYSKNYGF